ncbi:MAG: TIGR02281 family clan AA aspartic protease [Hyphomicrobiales bacterium]|nr:TIGR02281 family clan AA aspartic protease [Hyphomicrobiales bacterium]
MGKLFTLAAMMMVMAVTITRMLDRPPQVQVAAATPVAPPPPTNSAPRSVTLSRGDGGHFWTDARIDGRRIQLVVDTGASHIALRASDAARLGIHPIPRDYTARVHTANGVVLAAKVQLRSVEVGGITVRDLPALVHSDEGLGVNLLGMSFLSRLRWTYERGRMVIEQ